MRYVIVFLCLCTILMLVNVSPVSACVGARALAMGGTFVGLADDTSATYWNPAALPFQNEKSAMWMHTANNRDEINYQDYVGYVYPLDERSALGLSYIKYQMIPSIAMYDSSMSWDQSWWWLSFGIKVDEAWSLGANIRAVNDDLKVVESGVPLDVSADTDMALDLAVYHRAENVSAGLLVQNANEPETTIEEMGFEVYSAKWVRNYRPGIAVRMPESHVIIAAEVYDATDDGDSRALRLGIEKIFPDQRFALRAGRYAGGDISALTLGAGVWNADKNWELDVAYMGGDLDGTWFVSGTAKF